MTVLKSVTLAVVMWCTMFGCSLGLNATSTHKVYVALTGDDLNDGSLEFPVRSIHRAQALVREMIDAGLQGDVEVQIAGGVYHLAETLEFGLKDSPPGKLQVIYRSAPESTVVISGGFELDNWHRNGTGAWEALWRDARQKSAPQVADEPSPVPRQLFIDGVRGIRARHPDSGYFRVRQALGDLRTEFEFDSEQWTHTGSVHRLELALLHDWSMSRVRVKEIDVEKSIVKLAERIGGPHDFFRINGFEKEPRFFLENSVSFMNAPNEFFFDRERNTVQLVLAADENPERVAITVPRLETLIRIVGTEKKPVRGIRFFGLGFSHSSCPLPPGGYGGIQASYFENRLISGQLRKLDTETESTHLRLPAAIEISFAEDCGFSRSAFSHLGGGGIYFGRQAKNCFVKSSRIEDVGGCGVMIGETLTRKAPLEQVDVCHGNLIEGNKISRCGQVLLGSVGVWVGIASQTEVLSNEIFNLPYSGVSVGWQWNDQPSGCKQNRICNNRIHDIMLELSDGGGIYTLGRQPGTVLLGNRISDIPSNHGRAESNGIFMDQGSSEILVEGNVISGVQCSPIRFHLAGQNTLKKNQCFHLPGVEPLRFNNTPKANIEIIDNLFRMKNPEGTSPSDDQKLPQKKTPETRF